MQYALPTPRSVISPLLDDDIQPSLYIPQVPRRVSVYDIMSQVGEIESVDWVHDDASHYPARSHCFVHFSMWHDTPVAEELYASILEDRSYRLYDDDGNYVICRKNRHPVPRYRGAYSFDYLIPAIQSLETAYTYDTLKPKHIRFDETGTPTVVDASELIHTERVNVKNIHQLAAEYEWWIQNRKPDVDSTQSDL